MNRRGFLGVILAAGVAPAFVRVVMPVKPVIILSPLKIWVPEPGIAMYHDEMQFQDESLFHEYQRRWLRLLDQEVRVGARFMR
jgi:hypothetical protein